MGETKQFMQDNVALAKQNAALEIRKLDRQKWRVLCETVWPGADERSVMLAVDYCQARGLDPFKKPVHIVKVWSAKLNKLVDGLWPGINELRTTASRTGSYAGKDATVFGPIGEITFGEGKEAVSIYAPEWAEIKVYRIVKGIKCNFFGPKVYWMETYATAAKNTNKPNKMWEKRPYGQLDKCAEAAALRCAFPEELGNQYTHEEMEGKEIDSVDADWEPIQSEDPKIEPDKNEPDEKAPPEEREREPGEDDEPEEETKPGTNND